MSHKEVSIFGENGVTLRGYAVSLFWVSGIVTSPTRL